VHEWFVLHLGHHQRSTCELDVATDGTLGDGHLGRSTSDDPGRVSQNRVGRLKRGAGNAVKAPPASTEESVTATWAEPVVSITLPL